MAGPVARSAVTSPNVPDDVGTEPTVISLRRLPDQIILSLLKVDQLTSSALVSLNVYCIDYLLQ